MGIGDAKPSRDHEPKGTPPKHSKVEVEIDETDNPPGQAPPDPPNHITGR